MKETLEKGYADVIYPWHHPTRGCTVLHFLICRLFKIKYEYVLLSMVGCIVDGPTAAGGNWKSLINVGLIMGVIAGACGNYAGIFVAYAVKAICGL